MPNKSNDYIKRLKGAVKSIELGDYDDDLLVDVRQQTDEFGELARMFDAMAQKVIFRERQLKLLQRVIPIGVTLSAEKNFNRILETVVTESQDLTNADGGTLYLLENEKYLKFVIVRNKSLGIAMGGTSNNKITFKPVQLYNKDGTENRHNVASYSALTHERVNIADAYKAKGFDFSGTKEFDASIGYRSKSFLTYPLENVNGDVIGVLQLINALDVKTGEVIPFIEFSVLEALVSMATTALVGYIREETLRKEIVKLRIEINESRRSSQVAEITDTNYFKNLQDKAKQLRKKTKK
ncbi:MAG: GAF domain-containing protein [Anaerolineae bacterium]|nr:GAF domain-containing protein [Anaerolineae bacterium]